MATNVKNAIAKALINGVVTDLFLKTGVENVVITENGSEKTLADKLTEIITALNGKATPCGHHQRPRQLREEGGW